MIGAVLRVRYELTKKLGETQFFDHYSAHDKVQAREVSIRLIKEPYSEDADLLANLEETVKRLSNVRQSGIEELYEVDSDDAAVFVVGQLTPGASIAERLHKLATFSVPATVEVGIAICEALQTLHRAGFADGDLSGDSIAMQADGEVRLQGAGLWPPFFANQRAREAFLIATADHCAPEVSKGGLPTPASDIYSLGILLFELLTGRKPYSGDSALVLALQHATEPIPSSRQMNPSVPPPLDHIIGKAMAKDPSDRYTDGGEMLSDLRMLQDALRFGKSLNWPLKGEQEKAAASTASAAALGETDEKSTPRKVKPAKQPKPEPEGDLPGWFRAMLYFFSGIAVVVVAAVMYLSTSKPVALKVPQLQNLTFDEAQKRLEGMGLKLSLYKSVPREDVQAGLILSTDPVAGDPIFKNETVKATVSEGSKFVEVPDLRGLTLEKARETLKSVGLDLDERVDRIPDRDLGEGLIVSQAQPARGKFERGTKVHVQVSSGRDRPRVTSAADSGKKYVYTLSVKLTNLDHSVRLRVDMSDARGTKTIIDDEHNPGETVPIKAEGYGNQVQFRIFYDGELVKQMPVSAKTADQTDSSDNSDNSDNSDSSNSSKDNNDSQP